MKTPGWAVVVVGSFLLVGCGGERDQVGTARAPLVVTASPYNEPPVAGIMPPLLLGGSLPAASFFATGADSIHGGIFSDGLDLSPAPLVGDGSVACPGSSPACGWLTSTTAIFHTVAPVFGSLLQQALDDASTRELPKLDTGVLDAVLSVLSNLGATVHTVTPAPRFVGYLPERGRWIDDVVLAFGRFFRFIIGYAEPTVMANLRERGARLYCAAREAQNAHQSSATKSMGKQVGFSLTLFGSKIDFLTVEPTLVLDGPQPYLGGPPRCPIDTTQDCSGGSPNDGAQAFLVPFLLGTQITPVSFLPSLPELRYPLAMITGDSEIATVATQKRGRFAAATDWRTVSHADAFLSAEAGGTAGLIEPLFFIGPVEIDLSLGFGVGVGQLYSDGKLHCPLPPDVLPSLPSDGAAFNDRLLGLPPPSWAPTRGGDISGAFDDGRWTLSPFASNTIGDVTFNAASSKLGDPVQFGMLSASNPFRVRAFEDDDRVFDGSTSLGLCAGISGKLAVNLPPLNVSLTAGGNLSGNLALRHTLRDATVAILPGPPGFTRLPATPMSEVTVVPSTRASAGLELFVRLKLDIDLDFFGDLTIFDGALVDTGLINLASYDSGPWDETHRFRLGTGSPMGVDPMKQPDALSHFPGDALYSSFPSSVDACLASPTANTPPPPPCGSQPPPANSGPPHVNLCVYIGGQAAAVPIGLPPGVCSDIAGYVASRFPSPPATAAEEKCEADLMTFMCAPVSEEQPWMGVNVLARIFDPANHPEMNGFSSVVSECVAAFVPATAPDPHAAAESFAKSLFSFGFCDATATLIPPGSIGPSGSPSSPPPVDPGSCH